MARIRTIKPEFPQSESMGRISRDARLAFILMWPHCDDSGRLRASSRALASLLFPFDDDAPKHISKWLDELEAERCIRRYQVDGNHYLQVENFLKHQKIDHPSRSNIPPPREDSRELNEPSRNVALDQGPRTKEGNGKDSTKESNATAVAQHSQELPDWVPAEAWDGFVAMRKSIRAPLGPRAKTLALKSLAKMRDEGADPGAILDQSTQNSWRGLFPLKNGGHNARRSTAHENFAAGALAAAEEFSRRSCETD